MNQLMIGAGGMRREGWKTLDCKPGADFVARIPPLPPEVLAIAWDEIEWIHGIGSLVPWEGMAVLEGCYQALRDGGRLVLEQPDFLRAGGMREWLFGDPSLRDADHMNRWAYTPMELRDLLLRAGFSKVEVKPAQHHVPERDFRVEAWK